MLFIALGFLQDFVEMDFKSCSYFLRNKPTVKTVRTMIVVANPGKSLT